MGTSLPSVQCVLSLVVAQSYLKVVIRSQEVSETEYRVDTLLHVFAPYLLPSLYALSDLASEVVVRHLWILNGRLSDTKVLVPVNLILV